MATTMRKDHCGTYRFTGNELYGRIGKIMRRGMPCKLSFRADGEYRSIRMDPAPGWVHLSSSRCVKTCLKDGFHYHSTLTLRRFMKGGSAELKDPGAYKKIMKALKDIERALRDNPSCVMKVRCVNPDSSVATIKDCPPLRKVYRQIKLVRETVGDHQGELTVSL